MSGLVRSEVEAALGWFNDGMKWPIEVKSRVAVGLVVEAARAWLSTPTEPTDDWQPTCCKGKEAECRLHQIAALSRNELMDALVQCEEELMMAESYIEDHVCDPAAGRVQTEEKP